MLTEKAVKWCGMEPRLKTASSACPLPPPPPPFPTNLLPCLGLPCCSRCLDRGDDEEPEEDEEEMEASSLPLALAPASSSEAAQPTRRVAQAAITISWLVVARSHRSKHLQEGTVKILRFENG